MNTIAGTCLGVLTAVVMLTQTTVGSYAQKNPRNSEDIVKKLSKKKLKTRGFNSSTPEEVEERRKTRQFINNLKTRQIVVEGPDKKDDYTESEREELGKIIKKYDMPSIDLVIYFEFDSDRLTEQSTPTLIKLGRALSHKKLKGASILVAGHTDAKGNDEYNLDLSRRRAAAVKRFLVKNFGLEASELLALGFGEKQIKPGVDPYAAENRRVQVTNLSY